MWRLLSTLFLFWACSAVYPAAIAENAPRLLLDEGQYDAALSASRESAEAPNLVLASEALSAKIILGLTDKPHKRAKDALELATQALEQLPDDRDVRVQHALAYGLMTRTSSPLAAWRKNYATKSLKIITDLQTAYPDLAYGDALLGAWHLGIIRKAGVKNAKNWYGATAEAGKAAYDTALTKAPNDIIMKSNYAISILIMDPDTNGEPALSLLKAVIATEPATGLERDIQARMVAIIEGWEDRKATLKRAEAFLDSKPDPYA